MAQTRIRLQHTDAEAGGNAADRAPAAGAVAKNDSERPNAPLPETGFEAAVMPSESAPT